MVLEVTKVNCTNLIVFPLECFIGELRAERIDNPRIGGVKGCLITDRSKSIHATRVFCLLLPSMQAHQEYTKQSN